MCKNKYNCLKTENSWLKIKTKHQYLRHLILMFKTWGGYFGNHEVKVGKSLQKKNLKMMASMKVKAGTKLLMAEASVGEL